MRSVLAAIVAVSRVYDESDHAGFGLPLEILQLDAPAGAEVV